MNLAWPKPAQTFLTMWAAGAFLALFYLATINPLGRQWAVAAMFIAPFALALWLPASHRDRMLLAVLVGSAARALAVVNLQDATFGADAQLYGELTDSFAEGRGLVVSIPGYGELRSFFPPLFPILIGASKMGGLPPSLTSAAFDVASAAMIWRLSGSSRAAAAYYLIPTVVLISAIPLKEGLATMLFLGSILLIKRPFLFGVVNGLICMTQPAWCLIGPIAFAIIRKFELRAFALAAFGGLLVLSPWWIRNALLFGQFVPLTTGTGLALSVAVTNIWIPAPHPGLPEPERFEEMGRQALSWMLAEPCAYLFNRAKEVTLAMLLDKDVKRELLYTGRSWVVAAAWASQAVWITILAKAARSVRKLNPTTRSFAIAGLLATLIGIWFEYSFRHHAFATALLLIMIGQSEQRSASKQQSVE